MGGGLHILRVLRRGRRIFKRGRRLLRTLAIAGAAIELVAEIMQQKKEKKENKKEEIEEKGGE